MTYLIRFVCSNTLINRNIGQWFWLNTVLTDRYLDTGDRKPRTCSRCPPRRRCPPAPCRTDRRRPDDGRRRSDGPAAGRGSIGDQVRGDECQTDSVAGIWTANLGGRMSRGGGGHCSMKSLRRRCRRCAGILQMHTIIYAQC